MFSQSSRIILAFRDAVKLGVESLITHKVIPLGAPIPRVGESVILDLPNNVRREYFVTEVRYIYEESQEVEDQPDGSRLVTVQTTTVILFVSRP
jgi:hypothetical protein